MKHQQWQTRRETRRIVRSKKRQRREEQNKLRRQKRKSKLQRKRRNKRREGNRRKRKERLQKRRRVRTQYQSTYYSKHKQQLVYHPSPLLLLFLSSLLLVMFLSSSSNIVLISFCLFLVFCPDHLVYQWETEIVTHTSPPLTVVTLTTKQELCETTYNGILPFLPPSPSLPPPSLPLSFPPSQKGSKRDEEMIDDMQILWKRMW